jgi:hypothetical protein
MYIPIPPVSHPTLIDVPIFVESTPFTDAPMLSFLKRKYESLTASSLYYDPANPALSSKAGVSYLRTRYFNTLSEEALKMRHNGSTLDMEVYVDTYTYIPKQPQFGEYTAGGPSFTMRDGDRYERFTTGYVYHNIEVPERSSMVWDGRSSNCINESGETVPSGSRVGEIRDKVKGIVQDPGLVPYTVLSLGGFGHTVNEPPAGANTPAYNTALDTFLQNNYNSTSIPPVRELENISTYNNSTSENRGSGRYRVSSRTTAAVLDGYYFKRWVTHTVYDEIEVESNDA